MKTTILFGIAMLCPLAALTAQEIKPFDAKPGLWETATTIEISGMPDMPGGRGAAGAPRTSTRKSCVTKESLNKGIPFDNSNPANCTRKILSSSSSKVEMHIECSPDQSSMNMKMVSDMTLDRLDAEHIKVSGISKTSGAGRSGDRTMETKITMNSKWLSSDCGDVKPAGDK